MQSGSKTQKPSLAGRRILVVEDEYLIADYLVASLEDLGVTIVGPAASVKEALKILSTEAPPEAAVLDINLGSERVYPVADELRRRNVPFVFASGYDAWIIPEAYATAPRLEKPVDMSVLAVALLSQSEKL